MLTSITPLGERGRGARWKVTVAAFTIGAVVGGAAVGAALGWLGERLWTWVSLGATPRLGLAAALVVAGGLWDAGLLHARLPSVRRQVNEDWMHRYRGWVYGVSYGAQLGAGIATIVTTAAVYTAFAACMLAGDTTVGLAIGATFGAVRAIPLLTVRRVSSPHGLQSFALGLERWSATVSRFSTASQFALPLVAVAVSIGWGG